VLLVAITRNTSFFQGPPTVPSPLQFGINFLLEVDALESTIRKEADQCWCLRDGISCPQGPSVDDGAHQRPSRDLSHPLARSGTRACGNSQTVLSEY
jgi:hypothetical protein